MKTILTTLNAKYIHTSLALRLLYVANKDRFDISFKEFVIKEDVKKVASDLLRQSPDIVGISVYIWNVEKTKELVNILKELAPHLIIILGGPEVAYEPEFFLKTWNIDYVISGEGEFVLGELLNTIEKGEKKQINGVSDKNYISKEVVKASLRELETLSSPYVLEEDKETMQNKLVYFETSRGCPYQCQYCLSSLEKGVRYFSQEYIFTNLKYLIDNEAKQIKFLDRTFNLNKRHTLAIFEFLIQNYRKGLVCQFEIYADLLTDDVIDYLNTNLPPKYFRFEIGIQSTYEPTNIAVKRKQDFMLLASNIKKIMEGGKIDLHLDLIAGLPYENLNRFVHSFNDVFALNVKEVQLGFLKMLRGTNLRKDAPKYGYKYTTHAPYEIVYNDCITSEDLQRIHDAEHALEKYWNSGRFTNTMKILFDNYYQSKYFELFDEIGQFYRMNNYPHHGYQLEDLFRILHQFLLLKNIDLINSLRIDYYNNFSIRPHGFSENRIEKSELKRLRYQIGQDKVFLSKNKLNRKIIEKQTAIEYVGGREYLLIVFLVESNIVERLFISYTLEESKD